MKFRLPSSTLISIGIAIASITGVSALTFTTVLSRSAIAQSMPATTTNSTRDTIALAKHLNRIGAKVYVAYWCPYCHRQLNRFGKQAVNSLNVIECDRRAANNQNRLCVAKGISGFPTWEINGKLYSGMKTLDDLAGLSNYRSAN